MLEHDRQVQLPGRQPPERGAPVDQPVLQVQVGQPSLGERGHRRGEQREGGEEGAEPDPPAPQPGQLGQLLGRQRQPVQDHLGVLGQQPPRLGRPCPLTGPPHQPGPGLPLQQRDLPRHRRLGQPQRLPGGRLLVLGAIAFCAFLLDGAASNWSAAHLHDQHAASPALAAAGFSAFTAALALGRLAGDRLIDRLGRLRVVQAGGLVAAAGSFVVVAAPTAALALLGWATLGAGLAAIAPAVLGATPSASELPPPLAIAAVTTLGYLGSFTGPPLVGALAELTGLSPALALLVAAALVPVVLARRVLSPRRTVGKPA